MFLTVSMFYADRRRECQRRVPTPCRSTALSVVTDSACLLKNLQNESSQFQVSKGRIILNYELKRIGNEATEIYTVFVQKFLKCVI